MHFKKTLTTVFVYIFIINYSSVFSADIDETPVFSSDIDETPIFSSNTDKTSYTDPNEYEDNTIDNGPDNTDEEDWDIRVLDS